MNRTGLIVTLAIAAVVGLVFGFFPQLDLAMSGAVLRAHARAEMISACEFMRRLMIARDVGLWIGRCWWRRRWCLYSS